MFSPDSAASTTLSVSALTTDRNRVLVTQLYWRTEEGGAGGGGPRGLNLHPIAGHLEENV